MLSTKVTFFAQVSACCEQLAVGKIIQDFFGEMRPITERNWAVNWWLSSTVRREICVFNP
jgi:hypothetical protein